MISFDDYRYMNLLLYNKLDQIVLNKKVTNENHIQK